MKIKSVFAAFLAALLIVPTTGCRRNSGKSCVYFELPGIPSTADPQTAVTDAEYILVRNLYEGLFRKNADGKIVSGVAESYEVSGNVYTFHLRKNAHWDSGEPITADDFVFGLTRAVDPATACPTAEQLKIIDGATEVLAGTAEVSRLAVRAADDHTLTVTLTHADAQFPALLTTAPCMPCNRSFFEECTGKYGLNRATVLCNGSYYLAKWNQTDFGIRIRKNAEYHGDFAAKNAEVFFSNAADGNALRALRDGDVDLAFLYGESAESAHKSGYKVKQIENICWMLTIGEGYTAEMRRALLQSIGNQSQPLPAGFRAADAFFPTVIQTENLPDLRPVEYDLSGAKSRFSAAIRETDGGFPKTTLYYNGAQNPDTQSFVKIIVGHWQQYINAFINIKAADDPERLTEELKNPSLQMAIFPLRATDNPEAYLGAFGNRPAEKIKTLLREYRLAPIAFETTYLAYDPALSGVMLEAGNGYCDLSRITK